MDLQIGGNVLLLFVMIFTKISKSVHVHNITHGYYALRVIPILTFKGITLIILSIKNTQEVIVILEWVYWAADRVDELARSDPEYREFARRQAELADAFEAFLDTLDENSRERILDYMEAEGDMAYRKMQLAYEFGKQIGRKQMEQK